MKTASLEGARITAQNATPSFLDRLARNQVHKKLEQIREGRIHLHEAEGQHSFGSVPDGLEAALHVNDPGFYSSIAFGGALGAGESYMEGAWKTADLVELVRILLRNREVLEGMDGVGASLRRPLLGTMHSLRRNTRSGSRRNIAAHYDLGNDFFRLWLDPTMMYSSAVYEKETSTLHEASVNKLDRICRKLDLGPADHVVEIGTGWGGFALHAAANYGCRVTTTTISREQYDLARQRVREAGLEDRVMLLLKDYRDLEGQYDKLVSIEMIEAVGHQFLDTYLETCCRLLKPQGAMLLQAITIQDQRYRKALKTIDFIKRYIFPGSFIPSVGAISDSLVRSTDMKIFHLEDIGPHYTTTLRHWRRNFHERLADVRELGYPEEFIRMWDYYLAYCEGGFLERAIGDVQVLLTRPECRLPSVPRL